VSTLRHSAPSFAAERWREGDASAAAGAGSRPAAWLEEIRRSGLVFNSDEWARTVSQCYGFEDCTVRVGAASMPLFFSNSPVFGRKLASAVFNSYASPLYRTASECDELIDRARARAVARRATLEIKSVCTLPPSTVERFGLILRHRYRLTVIPLCDYGLLWSHYSRNFRSHLRKARNRMARAGVRIQRTIAPSDVRAFHHLLTRRYRDKHRMIGQPLRLFALIDDHFLAAGRGDLWVAKTPDDELIGGVLLLRWGATVTACFGASHDGYQHLSIDAILKDHTMRFYSEQGYALYDLGLSSPKQASLLFAKSRFPGETFDIPYYYLPLNGGRIPDVDFSDAYMRWRRPFRYVPVPLAKLLSSILVRYLN
jgi:hypothetical protein